VHDMMRSPRPAKSALEAAARYSVQSRCCVLRHGQGDASMALLI
jgi:hypothetical protein